MAVLAAVALVVLGALEAQALSASHSDLQTGTDGLRAAAGELGADPSGWTPERVAAARQAIAAARAQVDRGRTRLDSDPVLSAVSGLPWAGDQVTAARDLAAAATDSGQALDDLAQVAGLYAAASGRSPLQRLLQIGPRAAPLVDDAQHRLDRAQATLDRDRGLDLLAPLRRELDRASADVAQARATLDQLAPSH